MKRTFAWMLALMLAAGVMQLSPVGAAQTRPAFAGVGVQVVPTARGDLVVLTTVPGSPAEAGGLKPGDLIVRVDDFPLAGSDFLEVVRERLWGKAGSTVEIRFLRPGEAGEKSVRLRRVPLSGTVASPPGVEMVAPPEH